MLKFGLRRMRRNTIILLIVILTVVLFLVASWLINGFGSLNNVRNIIIQATILSLIAGGQTFAILSGGIDLSNAWLMTVSAVTTAIWANGQNQNLIWVVPLVLAMGAAVGFFNGVGVSVFNVPPIIMTLAMQVILNGGIVIVVGFSAPPVAPPVLENLVHGQIWSIPTPLLILIGLIIIGTIILTFTSYGRHLYSVGTSQTVARFSGVEVRNIIIVAYMLCSVLAALAGFLLLGFVRTADFGIGVPYLFPSVVAAIVGGASILGGSGHIIGTVAGAILMIIIQALLLLFNLGSGATKIFYGLTILVSVWLASLQVGRLRKAQK